jgi:hypothetical protein
LVHPPGQWFEEGDTWWLEDDWLPDLTPSLVCPCGQWFEEGDNLVEEASEASAVFMVLHGSLTRSKVTRGEEEDVVNVLQRGDWFGGESEHHHIIRRRTNEESNTKLGISVFTVVVHTFPVVCIGAHSGVCSVLPQTLRSSRTSPTWRASRR